jgi:hypothetical protein
VDEVGIVDLVLIVPAEMIVAGVLNEGKRRGRSENLREMKIDEAPNVGESN